MIFVSVSHLRQSYHSVETTPVYLVSTVDCLRIHGYATVKISRRQCSHYCTGEFASMVVSKYWNAQTNDRQSSTNTTRLLFSTATTARLCQSQAFSFAS